MLNNILDFKQNRGGYIKEASMISQGQYPDPLVRVSKK